MDRKHRVLILVLDDKNKIALALSNLGLDYIEGGWPGANPLDTSFFNTPPKMNHSKLSSVWHDQKNWT